MLFNNQSVTNGGRSPLATGMAIASRSARSARICALRALSCSPRSRDRFPQRFAAASVKHRARGRDGCGAVQISAELYCGFIEARRGLRYFGGIRRGWAGTGEGFYFDLLDSRLSRNRGQLLGASGGWCSHGGRCAKRVRRCSDGSPSKIRGIGASMRLITILPTSLLTNSPSILTNFGAEPPAIFLSDGNARRQFGDGHGSDRGFIRE